MVIETADAVLVAQRDHAQDVKRIVEKLRATKRSEHQTHQRVYRPWGSYETVEAGRSLSGETIDGESRARRYRCRCTITALNIGSSCREPRR